MDLRLQDARRRWRASGSADDEALALIAMLRSGATTVNQLLVCAAAGMPSASLAVAVSQEDAAHECTRFLPPPSNPLFEPIVEQVKVVWQFNNQLGWGLTVADFASVALPTTVPTGRLATWTLVRYRDTVQTTFEDQVRAIQARHRNVYSWDQLKSDPSNLRLLDGITNPGTCLGWEAIDLGANWDGQTGIAPRDVRNAQSPHAGIFATAAIHTKWVEAMDGTTVPYVWAPGYQCKFQGRWSAVPWLGFLRDVRQVQILCSGDGNHYRSYAVPAPCGE